MTLLTHFSMDKPRERVNRLCRYLSRMSIKTVEYLESEHLFLHGQMLFRDGNILYLARYKKIVSHSC